MSFWESIQVAWHALKTHKLRSGLTTLGIMIGVFTVIGMLALIDGMNKTVAKQLGSLGANTLYVQKHGWIHTSNEWLEERHRKNLTIEDAYAIRDQCPTVTRVAPLLFRYANVKYRDEEVRNTEINGTTPEHQYIDNYEIAQGRPMNNLDLEHSRAVCLLGATVADKLFGLQDPAGKEILIGKNRCLIIGVLEKRGSIFGQDPDNLVIMPITTFGKFFGRVRQRDFFWGGRSVTVMVQVKGEKWMEEAVDQITELLRRHRKVPPSKPDDFAINTAQQLMEVYKKITAAVFAVMIGVASLSLLVGGIGIMNIMLVSVTERTREIGIRKAIGATKKDIRWQFLIEAIVLSSLGGIIGILLGFIGAKLVSLAAKLPSAVSWWSILLGFGFSAAVGIFFGLYPASRAAKLDPIEALRYE
ncbi:MAG: ABC transporter permease [Candidatus Edwardsbacteria bacterium]